MVYEAIRREGQEELQRSSSALAWSGLAAGLPDAAWRPLIAKLGYSVGFLIVVLGRQQLFTENTLTPVLPWLATPSVSMTAQVLRLWVIVLSTNLIGAGAFAWAAAGTDVFSAEARAAFGRLAAEAMEDGAGTTLLKIAGWLIALMVWLLPFSGQAKVGVIIVITYLVGLGRFDHIIAGSVETLYGVATGTVSWPQYLFHYMVPTLGGNVLGGVALVAVLNHAQVTAGAEDDA